jgi:hypothetical protein
MPTLEPDFEQAESITLEAARRGMLTDQRGAEWINAFHQNVESRMLNLYDAARLGVQRIHEREKIAAYWQEQLNWFNGQVQFMQSTQNKHSALGAPPLPALVKAINTLNEIVEACWGHYEFNANKDWSTVQSLVALIQQAEWTIEPSAFAIRFWDLTVRLFRSVETKQLFEQQPTADDLKMHEALLHALISLGQILEMRIGEEKSERANISAYIRELQDTFLMWHGPELEPKRAAELEKTIFGGPA